jgi:hypothetical protein
LASRERHHHMTTGNWRENEGFTNYTFSTSLNQVGNCVYSSCPFCLVALLVACFEHNG